MKRIPVLFLLVSLLLSTSGLAQEFGTIPPIYASPPTQTYEDDFVKIHFSREVDPVRNDISSNFFIYLFTFQDTITPYINLTVMPKENSLDEYLLSIQQAYVKHLNADLLTCNRLTVDNHPAFWITASVDFHKNDKRIFSTLVIDTDATRYIIASMPKPYLLDTSIDEFTYIIKTVEFKQ